MQFSYSKVDALPLDNPVPLFSFERSKTLQNNTPPLDAGSEISNPLFLPQLLIWRTIACATRQNTANNGRNLVDGQSPSHTTLWNLPGALLHDDTNFLNHINTTDKLTPDMSAGHPALTRTWRIDRTSRFPGRKHDISPLPALACMTDPQKIPRHWPPRSIDPCVSTSVNRHNSLAIWQHSEGAACRHNYIPVRTSIYISS